MRPKSHKAFNETASFPEQGSEAVAACERGTDERVERGTEVGSGEWGDAAAVHG